MNKNKVNRQTWQRMHAHKKVRDRENETENQDILGEQVVVETFQSPYVQLRLETTSGANNNGKHCWILNRLADRLDRVRRSCELVCHDLEETVEDCRGQMVPTDRIDCSIAVILET